MELVLDQKTDIYYSVPDGVKIGVLKFYIDAPTIVGNIAAPIASLLIPAAVAAVGYGTQLTRLKVWKSWGPIFSRYPVEVSFYVPGVSDGAGLEPITITVVALAIGSFIAAHASAILAIIGIAIAGFFATQLIYGPINPQTGERESPELIPSWMIGVIVLGVVAIVGLKAYEKYQIATKKRRVVA